MENIIDLEKILDEMVDISSSCIEEISNNEDLKTLNEDLNISMIQKGDKGLKRLRKTSINELDMMADELIGMDMLEAKNELKLICKKAIININKSYKFYDGSKRELSNEVVMNLPESLFYQFMIDIDSRSSAHIVDMDNKLTYLDEIIKYMTNEFDIDKLNGMKFDEFCRELMEMNIPFRSDIMKRLDNGFNEYGNRWKKRCLTVNGNEYYRILNYLKLRLGDLKYNNETDRIECVIDDKYEPIIQSFSNYLEDKSKATELRSMIDRKLLNSFLDEYPFDMNNEDVQNFFYPIYSPFLKESIINKQKYDSYLREWLGNDYKWKLLYRASEHRYTAKSFHEYCDDKGPTLIIIKSSRGWIFGGYTTQSWNGYGIYYGIL